MSNSSTSLHDEKTQPATNKDTESVLEEKSPITSISNTDKDDDRRVEVRSLSSGSELIDWLHHLGLSFKKKGTPRSYFEGHTYNDPYLDIHGIVVLCVNGNIVSSVRVFHRNINIQNSMITVGGIGEVSTQPEYEKRGYAGKCMRYAEEYMLKRHIALSTLHSSRGVIQDYYRTRHGYTSIPLYYALLPASSITVSSQVLEPMKPTIHGAMLDLSYDDLSSSTGSSKYIDEIAEIYNDYSKQFDGSIDRDIDYWKQWIVGTELKKLYDVDGGKHIRVDVFRIMAGKMGAYMVTQWKSIPTDENGDEREYVVDVLEYGHHMMSSDLACMLVCSIFIERAVKHFTRNLQKQLVDENTIGDEKNVLIRCPLPLLTSIAPMARPGKIIKDMGCMYKSIDTNDHTAISEVNGNNHDTHQLNDNNEQPRLHHHDVSTVDEAVKENPKLHVTKFNEWQSSTHKKPVHRAQIIDILDSRAEDKHVRWQLDAF